MLTKNQLVVLKDAIIASGEINGKPKSGDGNFDAAELLNTIIPNYWIWKTTVNHYEFVNGVSPTGSTFDWKDFAALEQIKRDSWREMFFSSPTINPSFPHIRAAFIEFFGEGSKIHIHLLAVSRREATFTEKVFSIPTEKGVGERGLEENPDTLVVVGKITPQDVDAARSI